jgi:putative transposase
LSAEREWFSTAEIAAMGLPGMPTTVRGVQNRADLNGWFCANAEGISWRKRKGRGGGKEVHYSRLPPTALKAFLWRIDCPAQPVGKPTC